MFFFLIGFMGAGKSTLGKALATKHNWQFVDLDDYIEELYQQPIAIMFAEKGEAYFRQIEADALRTLVYQHSFGFPLFCTQQPTVVACGGGTPLFFDNHSFMKSIGQTIYLNVSPKILAQRLQKEKHKRPLIKDLAEEDLLPFIQKKLAEREAEYLKADKVILAIQPTANELV